MLLNPVSGRRGRHQRTPTIDVDTTCRVCLTSKGECGLFSMNSISKQLLKEMFNIEVEEDGNQWKICVPCLKSIEKAAEFRKMATVSDQRVKVLLRSVKVTPEKQQNVVSIESDLEPGEVQIPQAPTPVEKEIQQPKPQQTQDDLNVLAAQAQQKRKKIRSSFFFTKKSRKNISCIVQGCPRVFSREEYMKRHIKLTHDKIPLRPAQPSIVTETPTTSTPLPNTSTPLPVSIPMPTSALQTSQTTSNRAPTRLSLPALPTARYILQQKEGTSKETDETLRSRSPIVLKDLRIKLVRCPDNPTVVIEKEENIEAKKPERMLPCPYCDQEFTLSVLSTHLISCTGQSEPLLKKIKTEPPDEPPVFSASIPPQVSIPSPNLQRPPSSITGHECDLCQEKFQHLTQLLQHRGTHAEPTGSTHVPQPPKRQAAIDASNSIQDSFTNHKCPHCGKNFSERWLLVRHLNVMHGIQDADSSKKLKRKVARRLSDPTPLLRFSPKKVNGSYACCGKIYTNRSSFNTHKTKKHPDQVEQRAFYCQICHAKIMGRRALYKHYSTVHNGERATMKSCNVCGKEYVGTFQIYYHKKAAHPELFRDQTAEEEAKQETQENEVEQTAVVEETDTEV